MNLTFTIPIYQAKEGAELHWTTLGLGEIVLQLSGRSVVKLQRKLSEQLRKRLRELPQSELERIRFVRGISLERTQLQLNMQGPRGRQRVAGRFPWICEPRWINDENRVNTYYHPLRQTEWFAAKPDEMLVDQADIFARRSWTELDEEQILQLTCNGKDQIRLITLSADVPSLLERYKKRKKEQKSQRRPRKPVLGAIGSNQTQRAIDGVLPLGSVREPYRSQLSQLLTGRRKRSAVVIGAAQVGKSTLIHRVIADLLEADDFPAHRNLDEIHNVWLISGKRLIAGMSEVGEWEERCFDLLGECKKQRAILWAEDLHLFGRLGQSQQSSRSLAQVLRGPVQRGQLTLLGECSREHWQRLEDDAPTFAQLFARRHVHPTSADETLQLMIDEARSLEQRYRCRFHPHSYRSVIEIAGSLLSHAALPGSALELMRQVAERSAAQRRSGGQLDAPINAASSDPGLGNVIDIRAADVLAQVSQRTGIPAAMLAPSEKLDVPAMSAAFAGRVMGQPLALKAATQLVCRVRAGLCDPNRPYAVMLFTGPTGTGKTEMARCLAEQLYGSAERLVRFDMSEYVSAGAVARLIGDHYQPEGQLSERIRRQPYCVLLLDEIEKAHTSVLYLLLQLFDEGRLTDAAGNVAHFQHTVVVMTSNLGARLSRPIGFGQSTAPLLAEIDKAVRRHFPPELFNRIDQVVPFHPLDEVTAERIATKEMARLLARRGLKERNVFVYANQRVKRRVVAEAFDPRLGARTVKRYLEDHLGSLLAEHLSRGGRAHMQVIRIYEGDGDFRLHAEPLVEADPEDAAWPMEALAEQSVAQLLPQLPGWMRRLRDLLAIHQKQRKKTDALSLKDESLYFADRYTQRLEELIDWLEVRTPALARRGERSPTGISARRLTATRPRGAVRVRAGYRKHEATSKSNLLDHLAECYAFDRNAPSVRQPGAHRVVLQILRMGQQRPQQALGTEPQQGLFEWLVEAYAEPATFERAAVLLRDGSTKAVNDLKTLHGRLAQPVTMVVLEVAGLFLRDRFEGERGSQIWRSLASEPEIVRVRLAPPTTDSTPLQLVSAHVAAVRDFEQALEEGRTPLPENPQAFDPAVRTWSFQPPLDSSIPFSVEIEDFRRSFAQTLNVRAVGQALDHLRLLWRSRQDGDGSLPLSLTPGVRRGR